jgi:DNA-binding transcriptional ArsR family regulator
VSGDASVTDLAKSFDMTLPAISKHLKVLERAGLITRGREAQWRPCKLEAGPLKEVAEWAERYRRFYDESFDRLDEYLHELQTRGKTETWRSARAILRFEYLANLELPAIRTYPLEEAAAALAEFDRGHVRGKLVLLTVPRRTG